MKVLEFPDDSFIGVPGGDRNISFQVRLPKDCFRGILAGFAGFADLEWPRADLEDLLWLWTDFLAALVLAGSRIKATLVGFEESPT